MNYFDYAAFLGLGFVPQENKHLTTNFEIDKKHLKVSKGSFNKKVSISFNILHLEPDIFLKWIN